MDELTPAEAAAERAWKPRANQWAIALTVTLATFMEVLDTSIANVALPHIAGSLGASNDEATWVLTSYLVSNAIILPASAYLTTFIGRKKFYMICVVLFGHQLHAVRPGAVAAHAGLLPRAAGSGRRRSCAERAGHPRRHLLAQGPRQGLCDVWAGSGVRAGDRAYAGRLDHRQLQLALDLLHQRADCDPEPLPDQPAGGRPAAHQARGGEVRSATA